MVDPGFENGYSKLLRDKKIGMHNYIKSNYLIYLIS
jgi:hypothetical protein